MPLSVGTAADQQAYDGELHCCVRRTRVAANCRLSGSYIQMMILLLIVVNSCQQYCTILCLSLLGTATESKSNLLTVRKVLLPNLEYLRKKWADYSSDQKFDLI